MQKDNTKRPFLARSLTPQDINGEIALAYDIHKGHTPPELIVIESKSDIKDTDLGGAEVKSIREKIHNALEKYNMQREESLIQPIIAAIVRDPQLREWYVEQGAQVVLREFDKEMIEKLAQLTAKIKSDPESLIPESVLQEKKQHYGSRTAEFLEQRAEATADTEQELELIGDIIDNYKKNKKSIR